MRCSQMVQSSVLQVSFLPTSVDEGIERKKKLIYTQQFMNIFKKKTICVHRHYNR